MIFILILVSIWVGRAFLMERKISQQKEQVQKSFNGLQAFNKNYFKCNEESLAVMEKYIQNHELKIYNLIALDQGLMFQYIGPWDEFKVSLEQQMEQCKASLPKRN